MNTILYIKKIKKRLFSYNLLSNNWPETIKQKTDNEGWLKFMYKNVTLILLSAHSYFFTFCK